MDFTFTDEQQLLLESYSEWLDTCGFDDAYFYKHWEDAVFPQDYYKELFASPFGTLGLPEDLGGTPIDATSMVLLEVETHKRFRPSLTPMFVNIESLAAFGTKEQFERARDSMREGLMPSALCITEPQAGSDNSKISASYTRKNGKVYINGHKTMITSGSVTKQFQVLARDFSIEASPYKSMTMWMVPADRPGIKVETQHKIGTKSLTLEEIYFDDVEIEEKDIFGAEHKGFYQLMKNFEVERLMICTAVFGLAIQAYNEAARYASQREQFGQKIGEFQLIQEKLANMAIKIENMRNMIFKVAWMIDTKKPIRAESAMCKLYCARSANEVADDAVQIFGGYGYTEDCLVSKLWRNARVSRLGGGTDEIMIKVIAKTLPASY